MARRQVAAGAAGVAGVAAENRHLGSLALASYYSSLFLRHAVVLKSTIPKLPTHATLDPINVGSGS